MARINIEEKWWTDVRRNKLIELLKGNSREADGLWFQACRIAQNHCDTGLVPLGEFLALPNAEFLVECDLAIVVQANDKQTPSKSKQILANAKEDRPTLDQTQVYVRGSEANYGWLKKRREAAQKGGKKSSKRVSKAVKKGENEQANGKQNEANAEQTEPSCSYSSSFSSSSSGTGSYSLKHNNAGIRSEYPAQFGQLWELYGRKGDKKESFEVFKKLKLSEEELEQLSTAIRNYQIMQPDEQYRKAFQRYLKTDWREDLVLREKPQPSQVKTKQQLQHEANEAFFKKKMAQLEQTETAPNDKQHVDENPVWPF